MPNGWGGKRAHAGRKPKHPRAEILCPVAKNNPCPYLGPLLTLAGSTDSEAARAAATRLREHFGIALHSPSPAARAQLAANGQPAESQPDAQHASRSSGVEKT